MSERILQALMQLFAIGAALEKQTSQSREAVESFLRQQISLQRMQDYLTMFDDFLKGMIGEEEGTRERKRIALSSVKMLRICTEINKELNTRQKHIVFMRLAEFMQSSQTKITDAEREFLETVASVFSIDSQEAGLFFSISSPVVTATECDDASILLVDADQETHLKNCSHIYKSDADGRLVFFYSERAQTVFLRYTGGDQLTVNGQPVDVRKVAVLAQGAVVRSPGMSPLYYSDLIRYFMKADLQAGFQFSVDSLTYTFPNGRIGIQPLSFAVPSGTLAGVMGGSGAGKSTLLSLLNGSIKPTSGSVRINQADIHADKSALEGMIGNVPQDDLLIEELTVYQNLYFNTRLCFGELGEAEIRKKVLDVLDSLGLLEIKDLRVGSVLNKTISGGQRKRLNIGLELIRGSSVLFVDEPTSGLSSRDAENVMDLLKQLALSGKLVFVVIHQPSSEIFRMFDQLLMLDTGGYPVFYGNPLDAMIYFKRQAHLTDAEISECPLCGNINPEQLFNILELHEVDEFGNTTPSRRITPKDWNELYKKTGEKPIVPQTGPIPKPVKKASVFSQWKIFFTRDLLAKLGNKQYLLINLLEAPVLALILGFILRYTSGGEYALSGNPNLPAWIFIGVIVALFLGLSVSAEEIIRDRKILQREKFLNLSRPAYLTSKIALLFIVSAIQSATFVLIGNWLMGIHDMNLTYWLIFFTTSCFANLLGLNISAGLDSAVTVYILIPFLLIPQILLSGVIVRFDRLHPAITTQDGVPLIGNIMASRWAFEALSVEQYANNPFEKKFYNVDAVMSQATYKKDWWIPSMTQRADKILHLISNNAPVDSFAVPVQQLHHGFEEESILHKKGAFDFPAIHKDKKMDEATARKSKQVLDQLREYYIDRYNEANEKKEKVIEKMTATPALKTSFRYEKNRYENESLEEMVKNSNQRERLVITDKKIIQRFEPVYQYNPHTPFFRAPLFASFKNLFGEKVSTLIANTFVIWGMTVILLLTLHFNLFRKVVEAFQNKKR